VPNSDEAARQRLPSPGSPVHLAWKPEHIHIVRDALGGESEPADQPAVA
jgi:hypothetical protein